MLPFNIYRFVHNSNRDAIIQRVGPVKRASSPSWDRHSDRHSTSSYSNQYRDSVSSRHDNWDDYRGRCELFFVLGVFCLWILLGFHRCTRAELIVLQERNREREMWSLLSPHCCTRAGGEREMWIYWVLVVVQERQGERER